MFIFVLCNYFLLEDEFINAIALITFIPFIHNRAQPIDVEDPADHCVRMSDLKLCRVVTVIPIKAAAGPLEISEASSAMPVAITLRCR